MQAPPDARLEAAPLVSVCVPTFNRAGYLRACLDSVRAQTWSPIEIVVSDNCSTDGTREMLRDMHDVRVLLQESNVGMVGNWNAVLGRAQGEYAVLLSDDDVLAPDFVATLVAALRDTAAEFAWSPVTIIDSEGRPCGTSPAGPRIESGRSFVDATLAERRVLYPSAIVFRRAAFREIGGFVDIGNLTDVAFRIALAERRPDARIACHPVPLVSYRIHASALTGDPVRRIEGALNFTAWLVERYGRQTRVGRLALLNLLQLRAKGVALPATISSLVEAPARGWFGLRLRWLAHASRPARALVLAAFPLLTLQLLSRVVNHRIFHKRVVS